MGPGYLLLALTICRTTSRFVESGHYIPFPRPHRPPVQREFWDVEET